MPGLPSRTCRKHGFSEGSYYLWRCKFGGMGVSDATRLKELETENHRLKKLLAEPPPGKRGDPRATNADSPHGERANRPECQKSIGKYPAGIAVRTTLF
jgi:hypothetical protein